MTVPWWMRAALLATAPMNGAAFVVFLPIGRELRAWAGWPPDGHAVYPTVIASFLLILGVAYLWAGVRGRADRSLVAVAAAGKSAFFALTAGFWLAGEVGWQVPASAVGDLAFAAIFVAWLVRAPPP